MAKISRLCDPLELYFSNIYRFLKRLFNMKNIIYLMSRERLTLLDKELFLYVKKMAVNEAIF